MSLLSLLPGSSAPAYCDIVPLFSQSIAFNRTGAHWPNWKGLRPAFHQSHSRAGCSVHRAQRCKVEVCGIFFFTFLSQCFCTLVLFLSPFLCHYLMPSYGFRNILWEINIRFPINTFLSFLPCLSIDSNREKKSATPSMKSVFIFHLFVSYLLLRHVIYVCLIFSRLYLQLFCGRQTLKESVSLMWNSCVCFNEYATLTYTFNLLCQRSGRQTNTYISTLMKEYLSN